MPLLALALASSLTLASETWIDPPMAGWMESTLAEKRLPDNRVEFLIDGTEMYPAWLELLRSARRSIDVATFLWCDDASGLAVARELAVAAGRGVRVRVLIDFFNNKPHEEAYATLRRAGIRPLLYNPPYWGLERLNDHTLHEKITVADGARAIVAGANFCDEYLVGGPRGLWHDLAVRAEGPAAARLQERYDQTWNWMARTENHERSRYSIVLTDPSSFARARPPYPVYREPTPASGEKAGDASAMVLWQQPYLQDLLQDPSGRFLRVYSELVKRARRRVVLYAPYYVPPMELEQAILETARRGIDFTLLTNSEGTNDVGVVTSAAVGHYGRALEAGVKLFEYQGRTLHAKALLVDDLVVAIGSHNFTNRSFATSGEANLLLGDPDVLDKFRRMLAADLAVSRRVDRADLESRSDGVGEGLWMIVARWFRWLM